MSAIEDAIVKLDAKLRGVPFEFAFLGGSVLTVLCRQNPRPTFERSE